MLLFSPGSPACIDRRRTINHQGELAPGKLIRNRIRTVLSAELYQAAIGNRIKISFTFVVDGSVVLECKSAFRAVPSAPKGKWSEFQTHWHYREQNKGLTENIR